MRETILMQWKASQNSAQRETAWLMHGMVDSFAQSFELMLKEVINAETQL